MPREEAELEGRIAALESRMGALEKGLAALSRQLEESRNQASALAMPPLFGGGGGGSTPGSVEPISEEAISWAGRTSLLQRAATFSFLLVIALILRTITDAGIVDKLLGGIIGMGYAAALMIASWFMYKRKSPEAPVFAASGAVLLATVVVETHGRFLSLPLIPAYLTLVVMGIGLALISRRYTTYLPVSAGVIGMCVAGAAMDFPSPSWPLLSLILLFANILGFYASSLKNRSWLRWLVLFVTIGLIGYWSFLLGDARGRGGPIPDSLYPAFFAPSLGLLFAAFLVFAIVGLNKGFERGFDAFDLATPSVAGIWVYASATMALGASASTAWALLLIGAVLVIAHFGLSLWLAARGGSSGAEGSGASEGRQTAAATSFSVAALLLLLMTIPRGGPAFVPGLAIAALASLGLAFLARLWDSGGMRAASYFGQITAATVLAADILARNHGTLRLWEMIPALLLAGSGIFQFLWCRGIIRPRSARLAIEGGGDRVAVAVLVGGLSSLFMAGRIGIAWLIAPLLAESQIAWFVCGQSVLINVAAVAVVIFAASRVDRELRNVALLIVIAGALKVFMLDLLNYHGLPLVASVLTFGLAAAVFSVALGRWPRIARADGDSGEGTKA
ncbi:MAG TPA: hypothetical protein VMV83_03535 [Rectinemataceae bacterium]|nr:hypothetical protein [Rectinemataceae bacterium]